MSSAKKKIAILVGSLREGSLNRKVAKDICGASNRLDCEIVEIGQLPLYNPDLEGSDAAKPWDEFRGKLAHKDGVLFVTPEYNRTIPGALKNAIDVGSRPYGKSVYSKKPAAVVTVSPGNVGGALANHALRQCLVFLDMPAMQQPETYLGGINDDKFGDDGKISDESLAKFIGTIAEAFADWVDLIQHGQGRILDDQAKRD